MQIWKNVNLKKRKSGKEIGKIGHQKKMIFGETRIGKNANLEELKFGKMETWKIETWKMETWKKGNLEN